MFPPSLPMAAIFGGHTSFPGDCGISTKQINVAATFNSLIVKGCLLSTNNYMVPAHGCWCLDSVGIVGEGSRRYLLDNKVL